MRPKLTGTPWARDIRCYKYHRSDNTYRPHKGDWLYLRKRMWLRKYQESCGCAHCGISDPLVLEFDHLDPLAKSGNILCNKFIKSVTTADLISEVRKCQVLCANCHKIKTVTNQDFSRRTHSVDKRYEDWLKYQETTNDSPN